MALDLPRTTATTGCAAACGSRGPWRATTPAAPARSSCCSPASTCPATPSCAHPAPPVFAPPFFPATTHRMLLQARPDQREGELHRGAHILEDADGGQPVGALRFAHDYSEHARLAGRRHRRRLQLRLRRVEGDAAAGSLRRRQDDARARRPLAGRAIAGCGHGDRLGRRARFRLQLGLGHRGCLGQQLLPGERRHLLAVLARDAFGRGGEGPTHDSSELR